jgi:hypothetical protein
MSVSVRLVGRQALKARHVCATLVLVGIAD